jgi:hypothetical protein
MGGLRERIGIERVNLAWAQWVAREFHYLHRPVHPRAHPFAYRVSFDGLRKRPDGKPCGMLMFATVHYTRQRGLFGYDWVSLHNGREIWRAEVCQKESRAVYALLRARCANHPGWRAEREAGLDKWQVLVLSRMWLHDDLPRNAETCALGKVWKRVQRDWLAHHPPVDVERPYHIRLILSWCDTDAGHDGTVYRAANFEEIKRTRSRPRHGRSNTRGSGGFNLIQFAYRLKEPRWKFEQGRLPLRFSSPYRTRGRDSGVTTRLSASQGGTG